MMTELTEVIRKALAEYPTEQPEGLAKIIVEQGHDVVVMRAFLQELLTSRIKDLIRMDGNAIRSQVCDEQPKGQQGGGSTRFSYRQSWQQMLDSRITVDGQLKRTGSCTREDLVSCIQSRQTLIGHIERQIAHFEMLVGLLDRYGVATLDDIPPQE